MKKLKISWSDFDEATKEIALHYKKQELKLIIGVSRGGLPLAVKLSNILDIPMTPLEWQTRDGSRRDFTKLRSVLSNYKEKDILFIDDICDSGKTIAEISMIASKSRWCTLVTKQWNKVEFSPIDLIDEERWIVFPWEI